MDLETSTGDVHTTWFNNGLQRRYACDRCRGHKLRCNRDVMASMNAPCQRCTKAKANCIISSSFRPDKPWGQEKETEKAKRSSAGESGDKVSRKRKGNGTSAEEVMSYSSDCNRFTDSEESRRASKPPSQFSHSNQAQNKPLSPLNLENSEPFEHQNNHEDNGDTLRLFSVPWMDIVSGGVDGVPDLSSGEDISDPIPDLEGFDFSNSKQSNFTLSPSYDMSNTNINNFASPQNPVTTGEQAIDLGASPTHVFERQQLTEDFDLSHVPNTSPWPSPSREKIMTVTDRKEACIQKLTELSASLMKDLNRMMTCKLASSFLFTQSNSHSAEYLFRTIDGSLSQNNAVGRALEGTEKFLEILQDFKQPLQAQIPRDEVNFPGLQESNMMTPDSRMESRWSIIETYLSRAAPPTPDSNSCSPSELLTLDLPSTLTILNCYTCLLKIFEAVFETIQHSLEVSPSSPLYAKLPPTVPGFHISGFQLKSYRSLQIKILIEVTRHMLDSMLKELGFQKSDGRGGAFEDPTFKALLQTLLKQEAVDVSDKDATGMKKVRDLLIAVESALATQK